MKKLIAESFEEFITMKKQTDDVTPLSEGHYVRDYNNDWDHPEYNISKARFREAVEEVGKKLGYPHVFGTPSEDWKKSTIKVTLSNFPAEDVKTSRGKSFLKSLINIISLETGHRVTGEFKITGEHYSDEKGADFDYDKTSILFKFA